MSEEAKPAAEKAKETIYVDVEDDITAIIDKVEAAKAKMVALVLPKRSTTLQSTVNMRLLKRSSESASKDVVLVTSEAALLPLAGTVGLHVAKNLQSAPKVPTAAAAVATKPVDDSEDAEPTKIDYDKPHGELADEEEAAAIPLKDREAEAAKPVKKVEKGKGLKVPNFDLFRSRLGLGITAVVLLILFFIVGGKILPSATITLQTTSDPVSASVNLITSATASKLDLKNNIIPAQLKTTSQSATKQVTATGQKNLGSKASGSVSLSAGPCGPTVPSSVPAGSAVTTAGLTYITQSDTSFSPSVSGGSCSFRSASSTPIKAQSGGSNYNVSSATFTVAGRSDVSGTGSASGGTDKTVTVLSQSDVDNAVKDVTANGSQDLTDKFKQKLSGSGLYVLDSTLKTGKAQITASPAVGQQASSSTVTIKVPYTVLTVTQDDLKKAITDALNKEIDTKHQRLSTTDVLKDADVTVQSQGSPTKASLSVTESTTAVPQLDEASVKAQAEGKKTGEIHDQLINLPGIKDVQVSLSPFWVSKAPTNPNKIHIVLQAITTTNQSSGQQP